MTKRRLKEEKMREIKFRAFHKETKTMLNIQNMLSFSNDGSIWINENKQKPINTFAGWVGKDFVLMQYTGLKDKNGVEIYEGDICRCLGGYEFNGYYQYNKIYEVRWQGSGLEMMIGDCGYGWNYSSGFEHIEVIGNIYENSELLRED